MYRNVDVELVKKGMTRGDLARALSISRASISMKLNGKCSITLQEAIKIKRILGTDMSLEMLFSVA